MAAAAQAAQQATQADESQVQKNSENLASSILSLKPSSTITAVANNLENLNLENNEQQTHLKESSSVPKLITESVDDLKQSDLTNNNSFSATNLNLAVNNGTLPPNNSSNSLSVKSLDKSHSRSPSPCRARTKSPNLKNELPDHGVRLVHG